MNPAGLDLRRQSVTLVCPSVILKRTVDRMKVKMCSEREFSIEQAHRQRVNKDGIKQLPVCSDASSTLTAAPSHTHISCLFYKSAIIAAAKMHRGIGVVGPAGQLN